MKKIFKLLPAVFLCVVLLGSIVKADELQEEFLKDLSEGLAARWSYDEDENTMTQSERAEYRTKLVIEETSRLDKYSDQKFENDKFDLLAHAYIEAVDNQLASLKYTVELEDLYEIEWSAGYNVRAVLLPVFVDSYGLIADESLIQEFRDNSIYSVSVTPEVPSTNAVSSSENEFEIYNNEGIKIYVTGFHADSFSKNVYFRIENLNHHNIRVRTKDYHVVVNGNMVNSTLWEEVQSGKTTTGTLALYPTDDSMAGIEEITDISFTLQIDDADSFSTLYYGDDVFLSINESEGIATPRIVYNDTETIKKVQELLNQAGYNSGVVDGSQGKNTNNALLQFEKDHGLPEITDITPELLEALQQAVQ